MGKPWSRLFTGPAALLNLFLTTELALAKVPDRMDDDETDSGVGSCECIKQTSD